MQTYMKFFLTVYIFQKDILIAKQTMLTVSKRSSPNSKKKVSGSKRARVTSNSKTNVKDARAKTKKIPTHFSCSGILSLLNDIKRSETKSCDPLEEFGGKCERWRVWSKYILALYFFTRQFSKYLTHLSWLSDGLSVSLQSRLHHHKDTACSRFWSMIYDIWSLTFWF